MANKVVRRISNDIANMKSHSDEDIYYFPVEDNIKTGYGLIIGPENTPYHNGFYIIKFDFPDSYPAEPPVCTYINFGTIRQSPNFHNSGKVCLSRLNTWDSSNPNSGRWLGSMDIYSILKIIKLQVLTSTPIDNEPPYDRSSIHPYNSEMYDNVVTYENYRSNVISIYYRISDFVPTEISSNIIPLMKSYIREHRNHYITILESLRRVHDGKYYVCNTYDNSSITCYYNKVIEDLKVLLDKLDAHAHTSGKLKPTITKKK